MLGLLALFMRISQPKCYKQSFRRQSGKITRSKHSWARISTAVAEVWCQPRYPFSHGYLPFWGKQVVSPSSAKYVSKHLKSTKPGLFSEASSNCRVVLACWQRRTDIAYTLADILRFKRLSFLISRRQSHRRQWIRGWIYTSAAFGFSLNGTIQRIVQLSDVHERVYGWIKSRSSWWKRW